MTGADLSYSRGPLHKRWFIAWSAPEMPEIPGQRLVRIGIASSVSWAVAVVILLQTH